MKKIEIWLIGGFGNTLFQILFGEHLKSRGFNVIYVENLVKNNFLTKYILRWKIHEPIYNRILNSNELKNYNSLKCLLALVKFFISKCFGITFFGYAFERSDKNAKAHIGYYQSEHSVKKHNKELNKIKHKITSNFPKVENYNHVIHFRGKDTLNLKENVEILLKAVELFPEIVIVSDDYTTVKEIISKNNKIISRNSIEDFMILTTAKKVLICSDSTFSLWAGILNDNAKIYAPKKLINFIGNFNGKIEILS